MVRIPYIQIPSVRVGSIDLTSDIGTGGATPAPPTPITYLTKWMIVGNSEVHTLPYPDGVVLPTGYKRCKYLEFHGTEHIDTGIIPEQGIGVSVKFKFVEPIGDDGIFGCRTSAYSADSVYCFIQGASSNPFISYGGKICDANTTGNFAINVNDEVELHIDSSSLSFTNGTNTFTENISSEITKGTKTLYIGCLNGYGKQSHILLRTFVLTNGAGNTIFNGIPCLDDNNVPCLYDTVSGTSLYNNGTGTFGYEIEPQPTEIWSCGEYNPIDGKYHILVQPQGGSIADIALNEPLRKVNDVADKIEFANGVAMVTRYLDNAILSNLNWERRFSTSLQKARYQSNTLSDVIKKPSANGSVATLLCAVYDSISAAQAYQLTAQGIAVQTPTGLLYLYDENYAEETDTTAILAHFNSVELIYELTTPTTELIDVPQIAEAESYSMVISQGGKAVEWSSFETNSE